MRAFSLSDGVGVMDPITYLDELESVFDAERRAQVAGQGADLAEAEAATVKLEARLRARLGQRLRVLTRGGALVDLLARHLGDDVLSGQAPGGGVVMVRTAAIAVVVPQTAGEAGQARRWRSARAVLRDLRRRRARVSLSLPAGSVTGTIVQVGQDYVELAVELSHRVPVGGGGQRVAIALGAIEVVREC